MSNYQVPYHNRVSIGGNNHGMVAAGTNVTQSGTIGQANQDMVVDPESLLNALKPLISKLDQEVAATTPPEQQSAIKEKAEELKETILSGKPDVSTLGYLKAWFARNAPKLVGTVTSIIIHPIVGRLVEATGDILVTELYRRVGSQTE